MQTHLSIVTLLCRTFATPHHLTNIHCSPYAGSTYLSSSVVMLPASPPAMSAKPKKRNSLAFQATLSELEKPPSFSKRCLSIRLTMIIPNVLKSGESQSGKATRTGTVSYGASSGGCAREERKQASKKSHQPMVNCDEGDREADTIQSGQGSIMRASPLTSAPAV